jgi:hypothetical protein
MAEAADERSYAYPSMAVRQWFALRERFRRSVPQVVDAEYLASALNMTPASARNNIIPSLKATGIVGEDNKPKDIAFKWRDDQQYREACEQIRSAVYPSSLIDLSPPESVDFDEVRRWFAHTKKVGENAATKMASFYVMLCKADPTAVAASSNGQPKAKPKASTTSKPAAKQKTPARAQEIEDEKTEDHEHRSASRRIGMPSLSLNLQVLISPDASPEQIDKVFESMAKHLKGFT